MSFNLVGKAVKHLKLPTVDYLNAPTQIIPAQQGDTNSRYFNITLYDDRGNIDLSSYTCAVLNGTIPSGAVLSSECNINGSTIICGFSGNFTAESGRVPCNITLTNKENNIRLTSQTFYVIVSISQADNEITGNNENYNQLQILIDEIELLEKNIKASEDSRVEAEELRQNQFEVAIENCEAATQSANDALEAVEELLSTLSFPAKKIDGTTESPLAELRFVALES